MLDHQRHYPSRFSAVEARSTTAAVLAGTMTAPIDERAVREALKVDDGHDLPFFGAGAPLFGGGGIKLPNRPSTSTMCLLARSIRWASV